MPKLTPSKFFLKDLERMKSDKQLLKKIVKTLAFLERMPIQPRDAGAFARDEG